MKPEAVKGKRVLVIDDVVTAGSTLEACIMEVNRGECKNISVVALASAL